ncbi:MAG TPA: ferrochelatase [Crocinitomix sp.]|nr:ferrochelatase [Crocinitomix sp.]
MIEKTGVLIVNLGTPKSPSEQDVKSYLKEFLMDKYVIDIPYINRLLLVKGVILNTRPKHSAKAYKKIWMSEGSPLMVHSMNLFEKLQFRINQPIALAMRYGEPSMKKGLEQLLKQNCTHIKVLPLYPQYAMSTVTTIIDKVKTELLKLNPVITYEAILPFYNHKGYLKLLAKKIRDKLNKSNADYIVFSYHGIPVRHLYKTTPTESHKSQNDTCCEAGSINSQKCYYHQCLETTKGVANYLNLSINDYEVSFQSRLGQSKWLEPSTANRLANLPKEGKKNILVVTPSFVSDCLETIEEIGIEGKSTFIKNGGETFFRVDCLNDDDEWVDVIVNLITEAKPIYIKRF